MRLIRSRRRLAVIASIITAVVLLVLFMQWQSTPFHVGAAVDDVWTYIHTDGVSDGFSGKFVPINKRIRWMADATTIQSETSFTWGNSPFAIQKTVYSYTNGAITGADSNWKMQWPF
jgi:hypothetical protein